ncbi:thymidylate kinase [alpha proteobacterium U9-1i]|nr:thymidylate kinase [alpha proteobacterium U9-1i]
MANGFFITLEGGEGAGKSTLAPRLSEALRARRRELVLTREPGGAPGADAIRALLLTGATERWSAVEEAMLYSTARSSHLNHTIRPALRRGAIVLCDRYYDSTRAYQIAAGGIEAGVLATLNELIEAPAPDLTLIFDLDPEVGLARSRGAHAGEDRFERKGLEYHARVRAAYLQIARDEPERCVVVDAAQSADAVLESALKHIEARLP